jgi:TM2 domain-containing membrane protein YozV
MQVTIIFEDLNLFSSYAVPSSKKSLSKSLKLRISKHLQIYILAIITGTVCLLFSLWVVGAVVLTISTLTFWILTYFNNAFDLEIRFSKTDALEDIVKEELYD